MQHTAVSSLTTPWRLIRLWQNSGTREAQEGKGGRKEGKKKEKSQREGQVPATPVKHFSWILSSRVVGCFRGFSTHRSDSWWGLFMLTFKDCHNTFNTPADLRSPLACLYLCKHVSLLLQHSKGHCTVSVVHMSVFFEAEKQADSYGRMYKQPFSCYECNKCHSCLAVFSLSSKKKNALFRINKAKNKKIENALIR